MNDHHLILGSIKDFISGETLPETHDEQFRQAIARLLVEELGYDKADIVPKFKKKIAVDQKAAIIMVDLKVQLSGKTCMIIKYGPGSLTTRHRMSLALSRIIEPYPVPVVVVTNGKDADILDGKTGVVTATGLLNMPLKSVLAEKTMDMPLEPINPKQREMETRIVYAFEIDDKCPCDGTHVCL